MRGSALPETAIMVSFVLIMLVGMLQLGLVGYYQISGDAAVFFAAHELSIYTNPTNITSAEATAFPQVVAAAVTTQPTSPPNVNATLFSNIYGCNENGSCQSSRYSGFEVVRPQSFQAYLTQGAGGAIFHGIYGFKNVPISSGAVEPLYLIANTVWDNTGTGPNSSLGTNYLNEGDASPFLTGNSNNNMNVPPYYTTASVNQYFCSDPWAGGAYANSDTCGGPTQWYLGLGEYLNNNNYGANTSGVGLNQVFQAMACHQRVYADLVQAFPPIASPTGSVVTTFQGDFKAGQARGTSGTAAPAPWGPVAMDFYDELAMYEQGQKSMGNNFTIGQTYFRNTSGTPDAAVGTDSAGAAEGPYQWSATPTVTTADGASFALVFQWDQPNNNGSLSTANNFSPLVGCTSQGEPGY